MTDKSTPIDNQPQQLVDNQEPEIFAKVLPAGGPLLGQKLVQECRRCPGCTTHGACGEGKGE